MRNDGNTCDSKYYVTGGNEKVEWRIKEAYLYKKKLVEKKECIYQSVWGTSVEVRSKEHGRLVTWIAKYQIIKKKKSEGRSWWEHNKYDNKFESKV